MMTKRDRKESAIKDLQVLKNIGPATARRLYSIGIKSPKELRRAKPEEVYEKLKRKEGGELDICVLYQLRGAIKGTAWWLCK